MFQCSKKELCAKVIATELQTDTLRLSKMAACVGIEHDFALITANKMKQMNKDFRRNDVGCLFLLLAMYKI